MPPVQTTTLYFNVTWVDAETFTTWCDSDENIYGLQASDFEVTAFATVAAAVDAGKFAHTEPTSFTIVQAQKDPDGGHATPLNLKNIAPLLVDGDVLTIQDDNDLNALLSNDSEKMQLTADVTITGVVRQAIHVGEKANGDAATLTIPENEYLYVGGSLFSGYNGGNTKGAVIVDGTLFTGQLVVRPDGTVDVSETGRMETLRKHDIPMVNGDVTVVGDGNFTLDNVVYREFNIYDNLGTKDSATGTVYKDRLHSYTDSSISVVGTFLMGRISEKTPEATEARIVNLTVTLDNSRLTQTNDASTLEQWSNAVIIGGDLKPAGVHLYNNYGNAENGSKSNTFVNLTNNSVFDAQGYILLGNDRTVTRKLPTGVTADPWQATARSQITIDTTSTLRFGAGLYIYNAAAEVGGEYAGGTIVIDGEIDAEAEQDLYIWIDGSASTEGINLQLRDGTNDIADLGSAITITGERSEDFTYVENVGDSYYAFRNSAFDTDDILVSTEWADLTLGEEIEVGGKTYTFGINAFASIGDASGVAGATSVVTLLNDAYQITDADMAALSYNNITLAGEATLTAAGQGWRTWSVDAENPTTITFAAGSSFIVTSDVYAGWSKSFGTIAGGNFVIDGDVSFKWLNCNPNEEITITENGSLTITARTDATFAGNKLWTINGDGTKEDPSLYLTAGNGCLNIWDDTPATNQHMSQMNVNDALVEVVGTMYLGRTIHQTKASADLHGRQEVNLNNSTMIVTGNDEYAGISIGSTILPDGTGIFGNNYYGAGANDYTLTLSNGSLFKAVTAGSKKQAIALGADHFYDCTDGETSITQHNSIVIDVTSTLSYDNGLYIYNAAANVGDDYAGGTIEIDGEIEEGSEQGLYVWIDGSASADSIHLLLNDGTDDSDDLDEAITITGDRNEDYVYFENFGGSYFAYNPDAFDFGDIQVNAGWAGTALGTEIVIGDKTYTYGLTAFSTLVDSFEFADADAVFTMSGNAYTISVEDMRKMATRDVTLAGGTTLTAAGAGWRTWAADADNPTTITIAEGSVFNLNSDIYAGWGENFGTTAGGNFVVSGDLTVKWINANPVEEFTITETGSVTVTAATDATFLGNKLVSITGDGTRETASLHITSGNGCLNIWDDAGKDARHVSEMNITDALVLVDGLFYFGRTRPVKATAELKGSQDVNLDNATFIVTGDDTNGGISIGSTIMPPGTGNKDGTMNYYGAGCNDYTLALTNGSVFRAVSTGTRKNAISLGADHTFECVDESNLTQHNTITIDVTSTLSYDNGLYIYNAAENVGDTYAGGTIVIDGAIAADSTKAAYIWIDGSASADGIHLLLNDGTDDIADLEHAITIEGVRNENYIYCENVNNSYLAYHSDIQHTETVIFSGWEGTYAGEAVTFQGQEYIFGVNAYADYATAVATNELLGRDGVYISATILSDDTKGAPAITYPDGSEVFLSVAEGSESAYFRLTEGGDYGIEQNGNTYIITEGDAVKYTLTLDDEMAAAGYTLVSGSNGSVFATTQTQGTTYVVNTAWLGLEDGTKVTYGGATYTIGETAFGYYSRTAVDYIGAHYNPAVKDTLIFASDQPSGTAAMIYSPYYFNLETVDGTGEGVTLTAVTHLDFWSWDPENAEYTIGEGITMYFANRVRIGGTMNIYGGLIGAGDNFWYAGAHGDRQVVNVYATGTFKPTYLSGNGISSELNVIGDGVAFRDTAQFQTLTVGSSTEWMAVKIGGLADKNGKMTVTDFGYASSVTGVVVGNSGSNSGTLILDNGKFEIGNDIRVGEAATTGTITMTGESILSVAKSIAVSATGTVSQEANSTVKYGTNITVAEGGSYTVDLSALDVEALDHSAIHFIIDGTGATGTANVTLENDPPEELDGFTLIQTGAAGAYESVFLVDQANYDRTTIAIGAAFGAEVSDTDRVAREITIDAKDGVTVRRSDETSAEPIRLGTYSSADLVSYDVKANAQNVAFFDAAVAELDMSDYGTATEAGKANAFINTVVALSVNTLPEVSVIGAKAVYFEAAISGTGTILADSDVYVRHDTLNTGNVAYDVGGNFIADVLANNATTVTVKSIAADGVSFGAVRNLVVNDSLVLNKGGLSNLTVNNLTFNGAAGRVELSNADTVTVNGALTFSGADTTIAAGGLISAESTTIAAGKTVRMTFEQASKLAEHTFINNGTLILTGGAATVLEIDALGGLIGGTGVINATAITRTKVDPGDILDPDFAGEGEYAGTAGKNETMTVSSSLEPGEAPVLDRANVSYNMLGGKNQVKIENDRALLIGELLNVTNLELSAQVVKRGVVEKEGGEIFVGGNLMLSQGTTNVKMGNGSILSADSLSKNSRGGTTNVTLGNSTEMTVTGDVEEIGKLTTGTEAVVDIGGSLYGKSTATTLTLGDSSSLFIGSNGGGNAYLGGGKNAIKLGKDSVVAVAGTVYGLSSLTIGDNTDAANPLQNSIEAISNMYSDTTIDLGKNTKTTIGSITDALGKSSNKITLKEGADLKIENEFDGLNSLNIQKNAAFTFTGAGDISGTEGANAINLAEGGSFNAGTAGIDLGGGANSISVAKDAIMMAGNLTGVAKLNLAAGTATIKQDSVVNGGDLELSGTYEAAEGKSTITLGAFAIFKGFEVASSVYGGSLTISVAGNASWTSGKISGVTNFTSANAADYKLKSGTVNGNTAISTGSIVGTDAADTISFGALNTVAIDGTIALGAGNDKLSLGKNSTMTVASYVDLGEGKDSVLISESAAATVNGAMVGVNDLNVKNGATLNVASNYYGTVYYADKITIGTASATFGQGIDFLTNGLDDMYAATKSTLALAKNAISIGAKAEFEVTDGGIWYANTITVANGTAPKGVNPAIYTVFTVNGGIAGTANNDTFKFGNYNDVNIDGGIVFFAEDGDGDEVGATNDTLSFGTNNIAAVNGGINFGNGKDKMTVGDSTEAMFGADFMGTSVDFGDGDDELTIGKSANVTFGGNVEFGDGKDKLNIGANTRTTFNGDVTGVNTFKAAAGTSVNRVQQYTTTDIDSQLAGTDLDDTFTFDNFNKFNVTGGIDFGSGTKDTLVIGKGANGWIGGDIDGLDIVKIGANSVVYADKAAIDAAALNAKSSIAANAVVLDAATQANDDILTTDTPTVFSEAYTTDYLMAGFDNVDFAQISDGGATLSDLTNWSVTAETGSVIVTVYESADGETWTDGVVVEEGAGAAAGTWDLGSVATTQANVRISVSLADDTDTYAATKYMVTKIA